MPPFFTEDGKIPGSTLSFTRCEFLAHLDDDWFLVGPMANKPPLEQLSYALRHSILDHRVMELCEKKINFLALAQTPISVPDEQALLFALSLCTKSDGTLDEDKINEIRDDSPFYEISPEGYLALAIDFFDMLLHLFFQKNAHFVVIQMDAPIAPIGLLTHDQAVNFVRGLERVDIGSILPENMRCMHCWIDYNDDTNEGIDEPVKLPCGHIMGLDCLVECLKQVGPRCGFCRRDIVELAAQASWGTRLLYLLDLASPIRPCGWLLALVVLRVGLLGLSLLWYLFCLGAA